MGLRRWSPKSILSTAILAAIPTRVLAAEILQTTGFASCMNNGTVQVQALDVLFNRTSNQITFDVAGTSDQVQYVTAAITVYAYGDQVYSKSFNPCDLSSHVEQLCPIPAGHFAATGSQIIPAQFVSKIPSIAFNVPDLDGQGKLELKSLATGDDVACIQSTFTNDKTVELAAASYAAAGIAGAALVLSGVSSFSSAGHAGAATASPTFFEVVGWFQSISMNGMLSVQYPAIYQSFSRNFAFSTGLIQWRSLQTNIDNFRRKTDGNLTDDSVPYLENSTIVYQASSQSDLTPRTVSHFHWDGMMLHVRQVVANVDGNQTTIGASGAANNTANGATNSTSGSMNFVHGIQGYVEQLTIPQSNTFMTVLLIFAIVVANIIVSILLVKVVLEAWAVFGSFPKKLTGFRKRYWWLMAKWITNLIFLLYGVWTMYCIYQFTTGDSWAAKLLAAITLALFSAVLIGFTWKIWKLAHQAKKAEGDTSALFEDKEIWVRYSIFYDSYKRSCWWLFVPLIVYMLARGCVIAGADGHGLVQCGGQLIIEAIFLLMLLIYRPYTLKSGNWINIVIHVVRVLSVICILIFVEELGVSQTTKSITGLALIVVQAVLTALLAILIAVNSIIFCCKINPHRKQRKEAEAGARRYSDLTQLDARNSLLVYSLKKTDSKSEIIPMQSRDQSTIHLTSNPTPPAYLDASPARFGNSNESWDSLTKMAASMGTAPQHPRSDSPAHLMNREPQLPDLSFKGYGL